MERIGVEIVQDFNDLFRHPGDANKRLKEELVMKMARELAERIILPAPDSAEVPTTYMAPYSNGGTQLRYIIEIDFKQVVR